jgi:hypothetical protein
VAAAYRERRRVEQRIRDWWVSLPNASGSSPVPPEPDPVELWTSFWSHTPFRAAAATIENARCAFSANQHDIVDACLKLAVPELEKVPIETEFHEVAKRLQSSLKKGAKQAKKKAERPKEDGVGQRLGGPAFNVLELGERSGRLGTILEQPKREDLISAESSTLEILLRSRGIPRRLVGMGLPTIASELTEVLAQIGLDLGGDRTALKIPLCPLSAAPWELAFRDALSPFRLPSTWSEEEVRSESRLAMLMNRSGPPVNVKPVLLQPLAPQDRESPAIRAYMNLDSQFERRFDEKTIGGACYAIYIAGSLMEMPNAAEPGLAGLGWTASTVAHSIAGRMSAFKPAVILDVPAAVTPADQVHQLLMRNYFAQALMNSGAVTSVLATGLYPEAQMNEIQRIILPAIETPVMTRVDLLDRVTRSVRYAGLPAHDALFTANPHLPLIAATRRHA